MNTTPPPPQPLWWRRRTTVGLAAAGVVVLVLLIAGEASGWPFLRGPMQRALERSAGVPVSLSGDFRARLRWQPQLHVQKLRVGPASGIEVPHLLSAGGVELGWRWGDLWQWHRGEPLRIARLHAATLDARLIRLADGRASWQLGARAEAPAEKTAPASALPHIGSLRLGAGHITLDDSLAHTRLRIEVRGGESEQPSALPSGYDATVAGTYRALPLRLQIHAGGALPLLQDEADGDGDAPLTPLRVEGEAGASHLVFDGSAAALLSGQRLDGALRFRGPSLAAIGDPLGVTLPRTPAFDLEGRLGHDGRVWRLLAERATIGRSRLAGEFFYDPGTSPPLLRGRLNGPRLALADLGPAVGTAGEGTRDEVRPASARRVLPERRFDLPSLRAMDADVRVAIDELDFGSDSLAPMRGLKTHLRLSRGVLELNDLQTTVAGGQVAGSTRLDSMANPARWAADLRFSGLDVAGWIRGMRTPAAATAQAAPASSAAGMRRQRLQARSGGEQPVRSYLTGELVASIKVTGQGRSTAEILGSLDGRAQAMLRDGSISHLVTELAGLDLAQALGVAVRGDHPLPLRCARLDLAVAQGVVVPRTALIDNRDSTIRIEGKIDLRNESLDLQAKVKPKDMSPLSLRGPVRVSGTLGDPQIGIDTKRVAGRLAAAGILGAVAGPAALLPLIDPGSGKTADPCAAQPASGSASAPR